MLVLTLFAIAAAQAVAPQPPTNLTLRSGSKTNCKVLVEQIWKAAGVDRPFDEPPEKHQLGDACQPFTPPFPTRNTPQQQQEED